MKKLSITFLAYLALLGLSVTATAQPKQVNWNTVIHLKQKYIEASQIPLYYHEFKFSKSSLERNKFRYIAQNKKIVMDFTIGSQEVYLNGIKFHFSYPVVVKNGKVLISQIDLVKLIDPILRPAKIKSGSIVKTVIIDPGHGGYEPGTQNAHGQEKVYTMKLALKLKALLERKGFKVAMTRKGDEYVSLGERVRRANQHSNAVFVSLHFNAGGAGRAWGIETFTLSPAGVAHYGEGLKASDFKTRTGNTQDSSNIALATAIHGRAITKLDARDRGIRRARFNVITGVKHPGILFEGGFMSNYREGRLIANDAYLDRMALALYEGIVLYKTATEKK